MCVSLNLQLETVLQPSHPALLELVLYSYTPPFKLYKVSYKQAHTSAPVY